MASLSLSGETEAKCRSASGTADTPVPASWLSQGGVLPAPQEGWMRDHSGM